MKNKKARAAQVSDSVNSLSRGVVRKARLGQSTEVQEHHAKKDFRIYIGEQGWEMCFQFSSVTQSCPTLYDPMDCSTPGLPVHHQLLEFTQSHVHWISDTIQPSHPLSSPSPPALNLSQHQGLLQWVSFSHQVANVLEFQLQHLSFHWIFRTDFI